MCFICTGGTCRSFMAKVVLKNLLKQNNIKLFDVSNVGIDVVEGEKSNPKAIIALKSLGLNARACKAQQIYISKRKKVDLYITMTTSQKESLNLRNIYSFGELVDGQDIIDPYGKSQEIYNETLKQIYEYCNKLIAIIKEVVEGKNDNIGMRP